MSTDWGDAVQGNGAAQSVERQSEFERQKVADQHSIRRHNLRLILQHIYDSGPRTRATISEATGLNRSTVSSLTAELIDRRLLIERGPASKRGIGRPSSTLEVSANVVSFGAELMTRGISVCALDMGGRIRHSLVVEADNRNVPPDMALGSLVELVRTSVSLVETRGMTAVGLCLGIPGFVDRDRKVVVAPQFGWVDVPVLAMLEKRLGDNHLPVDVENAADLAALAESNEGIGHRFAHAVYLYGDDGIQMASISSPWRVVRGPNGYSGEIGHTVYVEDGKPCTCGGRGCLNTVASTQAILDAAGIPRDRHTGLQTLIERAHDGDASVLAALERASRALASMMTSICSAQRPEAVILGGDLGLLSEWLIGDLDDALATKSLAARYSRCGVLPARVTEQATARGGAWTVMQRLYDDPAMVPPLSQSS